MPSVDSSTCTMMNLGRKRVEALAAMNRWTASGLKLYAAMNRWTA